MLELIDRTIIRAASKFSSFSVNVTIFFVDKLSDFAIHYTVNIPHIGFECPTLVSGHFTDVMSARRYSSYRSTFQICVRNRISLNIKCIPRGMNATGDAVSQFIDYDNYNWKDSVFSGYPRSSELLHCRQVLLPLQHQMIAI